MRSSAVLVHIPEAEPVVGGWRLGHTYDAPLGVPPHVTLLFPFVPADELTGPFSVLTEAIAAEWPEHPPYEGEFDEMVPHLTVAESEDEGLLQRVEADVETGLPLHARVSEAQLYAEDPAGRWHQLCSLPLAG